jgi:hypothetical protein
MNSIHILSSLQGYSPLPRHYSRPDDRMQQGVTAQQIFEDLLTLAREALDEEREKLFLTRKKNYT